MLDDKILSKEAIIINGQSGDFNTGNHIPDDLIKSNSFQKFLKALKKNTSSYLNLMTIFILMNLLISFLLII